MPLYTVEHIAPLSHGQKDALAAAITRIHAEHFTTPRLFVNVRFGDLTGVDVYIGGRRRGSNRIIGSLRPGPSRTAEDYNALTAKLTNAWNDIVVPSNSSATDGDLSLRAVFISASNTAAREKGFVRPRAGEDTAWLKENLEAFRELAEGGDDEMKSLLDETNERNLMK